MPKIKLHKIVGNLFATLITKNIGKEEEEKKKRSGEET